MKHSVRALLAFCSLLLCAVTAGGMSFPPTKREPEIIYLPCTPTQVAGYVESTALTITPVGEIPDAMGSGYQLEVAYELVNPGAQEASLTVVGPVWSSVNSMGEYSPYTDTFLDGEKLHFTPLINPLYNRERGALRENQAAMPQPEEFFQTLKFYTPEHLRLDVPYDFYRCGVRFSPAPGSETTMHGSLSFTLPKDVPFLIYPDNGTAFSYGDSYVSAVEDGEDTRVTLNMSSYYDRHQRGYLMLVLGESKIEENNRFEHTVNYVYPASSGEERPEPPPGSFQGIIKKEGQMTVEEFFLTVQQREEQYLKQSKYHLLPYHVTALMALNAEETLFPQNVEPDAPKPIYAEAYPPNKEFLIMCFSSISLAPGQRSRLTASWLTPAGYEYLDGGKRRDDSLFYPGATPLGKSTPVTITALNPNGALEITGVEGLVKNEDGSYTAVLPGLPEEITLSYTYKDSSREGGGPGLMLVLLGAFLYNTAILWVPLVILILIVRYRAKRKPQ